MCERMSGAVVSGVESGDEGGSAGCAVVGDEMLAIGCRCGGWCLGVGSRDLGFWRIERSGGVGGDIWHSRTRIWTQDWVAIDCCVWAAARTACVLDISHCREDRHSVIHGAFAAAQQWRSHCRTRRWLLPAGHFVKSEASSEKRTFWAENFTLGRAESWRSISLSWLF